MQPTINNISLDARDLIKKDAQELRDKIKEKKNLPISENEKKLLLDNLKAQNREANASEEHKNAVKQLVSDISIIRQFGEAKKGDKLNREDFAWVKEQFYGEPEKREFKETNNFTVLQKEIMERAKKGTDHHRAWLQKKTDELVENQDEAGLKQLSTGIDFDHGKLILNTKLGSLKFAAKQATYDDIKNISGIKENENVWTENIETKKKGLRVNDEAIKKIEEAQIPNKRVCKNEQYLAAANIFPGGEELTESNFSTKAKDFFDLLGVVQFGFRNRIGQWYARTRHLCSASASGSNEYNLECNDTEGGLSPNGKGSGLWFIED